MDVLRILVTNKLSVLPGVEGIVLFKDLPIKLGITCDQLVDGKALVNQLLKNNDFTIDHNNLDNLNTSQQDLEDSESSFDEGSKSLSFHNYIIFGILSMLLLFICFHLLAHSSSANLTRDTIEEDGIEIDFDIVDQINRNYPSLLTLKEIRLIKARLAMMQKEVSILMLIGKSRDSHCNLDPTFCIGQKLANATQKQPGYIDASDPNLHSQRIEYELKNSLNGQRYSVMIDSLEKLPGARVMDLFQFIDKDETSRKKGMLLFVVYIGAKLSDNISKLKGVALAEKILTERWSPSVPMDSLNSVISRITGSIVELY